MKLRPFAVISVSVLSALLLASCSSKEPVSAPITPPASSEQAPTTDATTSEQAPGGHSMDVDAMHEHAVGDGTTETAGDLTLKVLSTPSTAGKSGTLALSITTPEGPVTDPVVKHTKPLHVVAVRSDLGEYLHIHPELQKDGSWSTKVTFPTAGEWRVIADIVLSTPTIEDAGKSTGYILGSTLKIAGSAPKFTLPAPANTFDVDGYTVNLSGGLSSDEHGMLMGTITKDGSSVELDDYLGSKGHLVAIRQSDGAYAHMHPDDSMPGMLHFMTEVPGAGTYRLFLQFSVEGKVRLATFTVDIA